MPERQTRTHQARDIATQPDIMLRNERTSPAQLIRAQMARSAAISGVLR